MRVVANEKGHFGGKYREEGVEFDVPDDLPPEDFTWFSPVDAVEAKQEEDAKAAKSNGKKGKSKGDEELA